MIRFEQRARAPLALRLGTHFVVAVAAALALSAIRLGLMMDDHSEAA